MSLSSETRWGMSDTDGQGSFFLSPSPCLALCLSVVVTCESAGRRHARMITGVRMKPVPENFNPACGSERHKYSQ